MKRIAMFVLFAMLLSAAVAFAGPLTGVPVIEATADDTAGYSAEKTTGGHVAVGYSQFQAKSVTPAFTVGGVLVPATSETADAGGVLVSAEGYKLFDVEKGNLLRFGAWYADADGANFSEAHVGYRWNKNWGVELGQLLGDAQDTFGKTLFHVTYDLSPKEESNFSAQLGLGGMSESKYVFGSGIPDATVKTDFSLFANGSWKLKRNLTASVGAWVLKQTASMPGWTLLGIPVPPISSDSTTVQWTVSIGKSF